MRNTVILTLTATGLLLLFWTTTKHLRTLFPPTLTPTINTLPSSSPNNPKTLHLTPSQTFQISIFEDLHFGEAQNTLWGPQQDLQTIKVMNTVLEAERPQLVVLNGDLITGEDAFFENATEYLDRIVGPMEERGLMWASVYGNHDSDFNISRLGLLGRERRFGGSLTRDMLGREDAGVTNYYIPVSGGGGGGGNGGDDDDDVQTPVFLLWFFDSRGGNHYQRRSESEGTIGQPNWVAESVVQWFRRTSASLEEKWGRVVPSVAFVHIPIDAMLAFQKNGVDANREPGVNDDVPIAAQGEDKGGGWKYEGQDVPFMQALLDTKGLKAVFSAHDHGNTYCQPWLVTDLDTNETINGPKLCFGQHTGYGGYGTWIRGSRQILLRRKEDVDNQLSMGYADFSGADIETWIRFEDGTESGRVVLNETYGLDVYPKVKNKHTHLEGSAQQGTQDGR